jgi:polyisoprenoid-binding protein YceI
MIVLLMPSLLLSRECDVDKTRKNLVKFISDASFEEFEGTTDKIDGYVILPGDSLTSGGNYDSSEAYFEVDLGSLDTGIGLRNRHMREEYLETDKYPYAHFKGKIIQAAKEEGSDSKVTLAGNFFIHGVERPVTISGSVIPINDSYHVLCNFAVKLSDYNIKIPTLMFLKISEVIELQLDFYVKTVRGNK